MSLEWYSRPQNAQRESQREVLLDTHLLCAPPFLPLQSLPLLISPLSSPLATPAMTNSCEQRYSTSTTEVQGQLVTWAGTTNLLTVQLQARLQALFTWWHMWTVPGMHNCVLSRGRNGYLRKEKSTSYLGPLQRLTNGEIAVQLPVKFQCQNVGGARKVMMPTHAFFCSAWPSRLWGRDITEVVKLTTLLCLTLWGRKVSHIFMIPFCTFRMSLEFHVKIPLKFIFLVVCYQFTIHS